MTHPSRLCHFVIDVPDLDQGVSFWSAALNAAEEPLPERIRPIFRRLRLPDSEIPVLLQKTSDEKTSKERIHLDLETDDVEAEVSRLEALGAGLPQSSTGADASCRAVWQIPRHRHAVLRGPRWLQGSAGRAC